MSDPFMQVMALNERLRPFETEDGGLDLGFLEPPVVDECLEIICRHRPNGGSLVPDGMNEQEISFLLQWIPQNEPS